MFDIIGQANDLIQENLLHDKYDEIMTIMAELRDYIEPRIAVEKTVHGSSVRVEIEDYGVGMSEETRQHAFERFYQGAGSRATAGNGLGLSIAKRIVELCGGEINITSELNRGTLFIITLPTE